MTISANWFEKTTMTTVPDSVCWIRLYMCTHQLQLRVILQYSLHSIICVQVEHTSFNLIHYIIHRYRLSIFKKFLMLPSNMAKRFKHHIFVHLFRHNYWFKHQSEFLRNTSDIPPLIFCLWLTVFVSDYLIEDNIRRYLFIIRY